MTSPEERISTHHDLVRDAGNDDRLQIVAPASIGLDFHKPPPASNTVMQMQASPTDIDQQILELKKQQELQKQMLLHTFQEQTKQLEMQHKLQLEHRFQELREQRLVATAAEEQQQQQQQQQHQQQQHQQQQLQQQQQQQQHQQQQQQRDRRDRDVAMKRKENCSANASPEVKQILNCFIMNRKQAASSNGMGPSSASGYRNRGVVKSSSGESLPAGTAAVASSHPYKIPQAPTSLLQKYESDFPLRKTASEPNLLKLRLKQSVIERKAARISGPALRRHERILQAAQRRQQKHQQQQQQQHPGHQQTNSALTNCNNSTPDSGPNSPPASALAAASLMGSRGSPTSAPIQEENEEAGPYHAGQRVELSLFSSPSMPNISLGRPHLPPNNAASSVAATNAVLAMLQHAGVAVPPLVGGAVPPTYYSPPLYGRPLPPPPPLALGVMHSAHSTPLVPPPSSLVGGGGGIPPVSSPVMRSASNTSTSSSQASLPGGDVGAAPPQAHAASSAAGVGLASMLQHISGSSGAMAGPLPPPVPSLNSCSQQAIYGITDTQVALAHLNKGYHRPLGRTQSAPLPLGHPMLTGSGQQINIAETHYENSDAERQHMLLTQKIRQTVLTRSARESHNNNNQLKEEDGDTDADEVIDLTNKKSTEVVDVAAPTHPPPPPPAAHTSHHGRPTKLMCGHSYLQQQRERLYLQSQQLDDAVARGLIRPLSRTLSTPLVHLGPHGLCHIADTGQPQPTPIVTSSSADHIPPVNLTLPHKRHLAQLSTATSAAAAAAAFTAEYTPNNAATAAAVAIVSAALPPSGSTAEPSPPPPPHRVTTGLAYDNLMLKHACICGNNGLHPEHSGRLQSVWARLIETDLAKRCDRLRSRKATQDELQTVHTEAHSMLFGANQCQLNRQKLEGNGAAPSASFVRLSCGGVGVDLDTTWNEHHTAAAARMAAGCVIDLAFKTAKGDIRNGFAVVRPPGHHAESNLAMGFCFFNSIAIAAKLLRLRMADMKRVLIIDWDVHHGNGTQQAFYDNPNVLYLSIHRHDDGNFFPGTGGPTECGVGAGLGFNVNVSWSGALNPPLGDAEYIAAFRTVVMPIARCYNPDIVLVSSGFDAAAGHPAPLGGYLVSPACFGYMTRELMQLANGKVVLALEGGYDLPAICDSAQECVRALLGDQSLAIAESELNRSPCQNAIDTLQKTIAIQLQHWPCVRRLAHTVGMSALEALKIEHDESETVTAMAGLSMQPLNRTLSRDDSEEPMDQDEAK